MKVSRKNFLITGSVLGAGLLVHDALHAAVNSLRKRVLRVAHFADAHVWQSLSSQKELAVCLHKIQMLSDKADFILNTGDSIFDALHQDKSSVKAQWQAWNSVLKNENSLETFHTIGNHDIWGWGGITAQRTDKHYGKEWAKEMLELKNTYYSFDKNGWHFVVLDSMTYAPYSYAAAIDDVQFEWLKNELASTSAETPVCIVSHIPVLTAHVAFKKQESHVADAWVHQDTDKLSQLFAQHKNVKLALSGHTHLIDYTMQAEVNYYSNGTISSQSRSENNQQYIPAFCVMNLFDDGSAEREVHYLALG